MSTGTEFKDAYWALRQSIAGARTEMSREFNGTSRHAIYISRDKVLQIKASLKDNRIQNEEFFIYSFVYRYYADENFATITFYMRP